MSALGRKRTLAQSLMFTNRSTSPNRLECPPSTFAPLPILSGSEPPSRWTAATVELQGRSTGWRLRERLELAHSRAWREGFALAGAG